MKRRHFLKYGGASVATLSSAALTIGCTEGNVDDQNAFWRQGNFKTAMDPAANQSNVSVIYHGGKLLSLGMKSGSASLQKIGPQRMEFPQINRNLSGRNYRYGYSLGVTVAGTGLPRLMAANGTAAGRVI